MLVRLPVPRRRRPAGPPAPRLPLLPRAEEEPRLPLPGAAAQHRVDPWELPGVGGVDVDDGDDALDVVAEAVELVAQVEAYQLLLRRVEAVPRRMAGGGHGDRSELAAS